MSNNLTEIPIEKWPQLRDLYVEHKAGACCYNTLQTFINWTQDEPNLPLKIYSPSAEWEVDGTYVAELKPYSQLFCNTLKDDLSDLVNGLNCFDNTKTVGGFQERLLPAVDKHFQDSGLKKEEFMNTCTLWYHIPREEALNFVIDLPDNITTKSLDESHAEQINRIWPHRSPGSVNFVKLLIRLNKSVGLFEGDKLVAWCLILPLGALGLLQVEDSYKRRGLGQLAVKLMSKYLAEAGIEVNAPVVVANVASRSMFEKLGFNAIDKSLARDTGSVGMTSQLIEIPIEKWPQLRDLYVEHKERASCYNTLQTFINWIKDEPNLPLKIYSPSEEWEVDGTYVAELKGYSQLYCNTLKEDWSDLVNALNCFDNTKVVGGVQELILPAVDKHFQDSGLKKEEFTNTCTVWYHLPREKALNFVIELPENITTKSLEERHAEQVNRIWPHRRPGSVNFVKLLIRLNKSVGLFEGDNLVAWCLLRPLGALGLLQVEDSHKRRGLGQLVVKLMSKYLAENDIEITASVVHTNETSRYMFEKLGFNVIDKVYWQFKM